MGILRSLERAVGLAPKKHRKKKATKARRKAKHSKRRTKSGRFTKR